MPNPRRTQPFPRPTTPRYDAAFGGTKRDDAKRALGLFKLVRELGIVFRDAKNHIVRPTRAQLVSAVALILDVDLRGAEREHRVLLAWQTKEMARREALLAFEKKASAKSYPHRWSYRAGSEALARFRKHLVPSTFRWP